MSSLLKRMRLQNADAIDRIDAQPPTTPDSADMDEKDTGKSSSNDIQEAEASRKLPVFEKAHRWDPNLEDSQLDDIDDAVNARGPNAEGKLYDEVFETSPYPEVRAAVRSYDEELPANTIRAWVIGMFLNTIASSLNSLFSLRALTLTITSIVVQLVAYPLGVGWTRIMPSGTFNNFGLHWNLNPGPFNLKENGLIVIMANAAFGIGVGYFTDTLVAQRGFYGQNFGWGFNLLLAITAQCVGFGITLVNTAFIYALHDHSKTNPAKANRWSVARYRWFLYVFTVAKFLSVFAFVTWIRPKIPVINQVFGGWTGISLIPITFDWTQITGYNLRPPLIPPWFAIVNTLFGTAFWFWIATAALHFSRHWFAEYLPISDSNSYDNTRKQYNVSKIWTPEYTLNEAKYNQYSPLFLSTTFALSYGLAFAVIAVVTFHTILFHGQEIWIQARSIRGALDDSHTKMMRKYRPAPTLIIGLLISIVWTIPIGIIDVTTNIHLGLNVFTEYIVGYMQPGRPVAMMPFKTYGYITMNQTHSFLSDLKLGHCLKIPQRVTFIGQVIATLWTCVVQLAAMEWALGHISDICKSGQANNFTCPNGRVFLNASVIFGLIGPKRIFSGDAIYADLHGSGSLAL
ncbi:small oligopeptide transporter [Acephala macrosclerotiorum]|nr:small oligopeptide transporter [Acephala macrosclerotiorum]